MQVLFRLLLYLQTVCSCIFFYQKNPGNLSGIDGKIYIYACGVVGGTGAGFVGGICGTGGIGVGVGAAGCGHATAQLIIP